MHHTTTRHTLQHWLTALLCWLAFTSSSYATDASPEAEQEQQRAAAEKLWNTMQHQQGKITLPGGFATLDVPAGFFYLNPDDSEKLLNGIWGNPPSAEKRLGVIFPADKTPFDDNAWAVTIDYDEDGHVADEDADKINYSDLLGDMKKSAEEASKERVKQGYSRVSVVGWAEPPHYDKASRKLYWAKEIAFSDSEQNTLNYNIRVLGRKGVLILNFIAGMNQLQDIRGHLEPVLAMASFADGNRYEQFNPGIDKIAAYGIGGLIAGKVLAKTGLLAAALLFGKKFGIVAIAVVAGFFRRLFGRK